MSRYDDALRHMAFMDSLGLTPKGYAKNDDVEEDDEPVREGVPVADYNGQGERQVIISLEKED